MTVASELTDFTLADLRRRRSVKWTWHEPDVLPAWVAEMDFPVATAVRDVLTEAVRSDDFGYAHPEGLGLAEAFAGFAGRRLGLHVDAAHVFPLADVVAGIHELIGVLTEPGDGIVINPPVYHPFFGTVTDTGRSLVEVPLGPGSELDVDGIDAAFAAGAKVLILCNPHNPVGRVFDRGALTAIAASAAAHGAWVLADEIHAPLLLPGAAQTPFLEVSAEAKARGIALTSASKAFNLAGLKCAVGVTAGEPARSEVEKLPDIARHPGYLGALASVAAFNDGDAWLDAVIAQLDTNRRLLGELLAERLPEVGCEPPQAGYLAWLDCRELDLGDDPAAVFLERGRVALSQGPWFGGPGAGFARLNFATSPAILTEIVERLATAVGR